MERVRQFLEPQGATTTPRKRAAADAGPARPPDALARVFLTGGSGFIGGALCARLVEAATRCARSPARRRPRRRSPRAAREPAEGHVLDEDALAAAMAGCAVAYHVAGVNTHCPSDPDELMRVNVGGTEAMIRAAARAGVARVVMTSSAASVGEAARHGRARGRPRTAAPTSRSTTAPSTRPSRPRSPQGARLGVEVVALNPSSVQGPGRASGNGKLIIAYLNGKLPAFVDVPVSVVDVADVAEAPPARRRARPARRALRAQRRDDPLARGARARLASSPG